jgi:hypothetical protein
MSETRRWTARITVSQSNVDVCRVLPNGDRVGESVDADLSRNDLQRDQASAAYAEACQYVLADMGTHAHVQLFKTTKAHGTVRDRGYLIDRNDACAWARKRILAGAR